MEELLKNLGTVAVEMDKAIGLEVIADKLQEQLNSSNTPFPEVENVELTEADIEKLRERFKDTGMCVSYDATKRSVSLFPDICGGDGGNSGDSENREIPPDVIAGEEFKQWLEENKK